MSLLLLLTWIPCHNGSNAEVRGTLPVWVTITAATAVVVIQIVKEATVRRSGAVIAFRTVISRRTSVRNDSRCHRDRSCLGFAASRHSPAVGATPEKWLWWVLLVLLAAGTHPAVGSQGQSVSLPCSNSSRLQQHHLYPQTPPKSPATLVTILQRVLFLVTVLISNHQSQIRQSIPN